MLRTVILITDSLPNQVEPHLDPTSRKTDHLETGLDVITRRDNVGLPLGGVSAFSVATGTVLKLIKGKKYTRAIVCVSQHEVLGNQ